jgi:ABC-type sugar transport system ATPase subunit
LRDGKLIESSPMHDLSGEQIVEKMLGHELSDIFPPKRPPTAKRFCYRLTVCMTRGCCRIFRCVCAKAKFSVSPGWPAREKPNCAKRCLAPAKAA